MSKHNFSILIKCNSCRYEYNTTLEKTQDELFQYMRCPDCGQKYFKDTQ